MMASGLTNQSYLFTVGYNLGRISTYALLGAVFGLSSSLLPPDTLPYLKFASAILLLLTAFYLTGITKALTFLEKAGLPVWRLLQPVSRKFLPVRSMPAAYSLGLIWGFIPCGLVYTALSFSLASGNALVSSVRMLCFGIGTLPIMLSIGAISTSMKTTLKNKWVQYILAAFLIACAWIVFESALKSLG